MTKTKKVKIGRYLNVVFDLHFNEISITDSDEEVILGEDELLEIVRLFKEFKGE